MAKAKKIQFELINPNDNSEPYKLLAEVRGRWHDDLHTAKICLAWRKQLKPDVDGHLVLGKCCKASDLQRELVDWDFVVLLNQEIWRDPEFTADKKLALLDHELCHAAQALDKDFEPKYDTRGRRVWRVRKHDIEEFQAVVTRHGTYKRDLERFAEALLKKRATPLLSESEMPTGALKAMKNLTKDIGKGGVNSMTISTNIPGVEPVTIDQEAAERIGKNVDRELQRRAH